MTGCALFGVFSWIENGGKESIEMKMKRVQKMDEGLVLDPETIQNIETTWEQANPFWRDDLEMYRQTYYEKVGKSGDKLVGAKKLFINIIVRTIKTKNLILPLNLNIDDFGAVLQFPDGVDTTVYWFLYNAHFPLLGYVVSDFQNIIVP
jgi:hypothetical protein